jgi:hypothetical protein
MVTISLVAITALVGFVGYREAEENMCGGVVGRSGESMLSNYGGSVIF